MWFICSNVDECYGNYFSYFINDFANYETTTQKVINCLKQWLLPFVAISGGSMSWRWIRLAQCAIYFSIYGGMNGCRKMCIAQIGIVCRSCVSELVITDLLKHKLFIAIYSPRCYFCKSRNKCKKIKT